MSNNSRTVATYNVIITLDRDLALKFSNYENRGDFSKLLEEGPGGLPNTAVLNNRDENFLSLEHQVNYGGTGKEVDDKGLQISIDVLEPELSFLRTLLDTSLSARLARLIERRAKFIDENTPSRPSALLSGSTYTISTGTATPGVAPPPTPTVTDEDLKKDLLKDLPQLFPKIYIMYGTGSDLAHWAGPFETVLIDANYENTLRGLEKTRYTFVATPGAGLKNPAPESTGEVEVDFAVRVPLFNYKNIITQTTGGASIFSTPITNNYWEIDTSANYVTDFHKNITTIISEYFTAVGIPNHLVILPDLDKICGTYVTNAIQAALDASMSESPIGGTAVGRGYDTSSAKNASDWYYISKNLYENVGLNVVRFKDDVSPGVSVPNSPVINQEQYIDLRAEAQGALREVTPGPLGITFADEISGKDQSYYLTLELSKAEKKAIDSGNYLAPVIKLLDTISASQGKYLIQPYYYWESNTLLSEAYKKMIGTYPSLRNGSTPSSEAGLFIFGDRGQIKNYLQAGIVVPDKAENVLTQTKLLNRSLEFVPKNGVDPFYDRVANLNDPASTIFATFASKLDSYVDSGLPFYQYILSLVTRKFKNSSFFDPDTPINRIPDEFNVSQELKENLFNFGIPVFRCNTSSPNVLELNIKTNEGFFAMLNQSFTELQKTLALQTASVPHYSITAANPTTTAKSVLAMYLKVLEDYSTSDPLFANARSLLRMNPVDVGAISSNLQTLLATQTGMGVSKVHTLYTHSASMSFLYLFFKLFNFRFSGRIKTLPMFEFSDSVILSRPAMLFVNRNTAVRQLYDGAANKNTTNSFYTGLYSIFGFKHVITNRTATSEFLVIKDPMHSQENQIPSIASTAIAGLKKFATSVASPIIGAITSAWSGGGGSAPTTPAVPPTPHAPLASPWALPPASTHPGGKYTGSTDTIPPGGGGGSTPASVPPPPTGGSSPYSPMLGSPINPITYGFDLEEWVLEHTGGKDPNIIHYLDVARDYLDEGYSTGGASLLGVSPLVDPTEEEAITAYWQHLGIYK